MKNIRQLIAIILCIFFSPIIAQFYTIQHNHKTAYCFLMPQQTAQLSEQDKWNLFNDACFTLPHILKKAAQENALFLLLIPEKFTGLSTTDKDAPIIEGSRVALAWTSAYFRFKSLGNVDCRIRLLPNDISLSNTSITSILSEAMSISYSEESNVTPEEKISKRMGQATLTNSLTPDSTLSPFTFSEKLRSKTIITPQFSPKNKPLKRVLITGAAGFIPSYICQEYLDRGYQVIGLDNFLCCDPKNIELFAHHPNFSFHKVDVTKPYTIEGPIDIILHLASVPSPVDYYAMPVETLRSGLHGTREALNLAREKQARFVFASSSEVYGDPEVHPQVESYAGAVNPIGKRSQYDQSKRGAETLINQYFEMHNLDVRIIRIFNTFGPRMRLNDGRMITNFIKATLENKPMIIHGDGAQTRSPAYATDLVNALIQITDSDSIATFTDIENRIFNAGNTEELTVNQIAEMTNALMLKFFGKTVPIHHIPHIDLTDPKIRKPDISHLKNITGYQPKITFERGLEKMFIYCHRLEKRKK